MLVIKRFNDKHKADYQRERNIYHYIQHSSCSDLVLGLLEHDDEKKILVMERGMCDLKTFAQLRREAENSDGPITAMEVLIVM